MWNTTMSMSLKTYTLNSKPRGGPRSVKGEAEDRAQNGEHVLAWHVRAL
jgi:hypothetical protein